MSQVRPFADELLRALDPELAFLARMITDAVEEARKGDEVAMRWLERCAPRWLGLVCTDPATVAQRLLEPARQGGQALPDTGSDRPSVWLQLAIWGAAAA